MAFFLHLVELLQARYYLYQALDCAPVPTRNIRRRGRGLLAGFTNIGWSNRLGWYESFRTLIAVNPVGVITGFGFAPASTKDQVAAETFFALRHQLDRQGVSFPCGRTDVGYCYHARRNHTTHRRYRAHASLV